MNFDQVVAELRAAGCVWAEDEARLLLETDDVAANVRRRANGEPLELVLGWAGFRGLRVAVTPGVFVPRRRTEFLAQQAISAEADVAVELCCGVAAISAAILNETARPVELHAADISPVATAIAAGNLAGTTAQVHTGDLFAPLPEHLRGRIGVLVANVPYVPTTEIALLPAEARDHEPVTALDGGDDGLALFRRLVTAATGWLAPGGQVMSEVSERQVPIAAGIVVGQGLHAQVREDDELGATVVIGTRAN